MGSPGMARVRHRRAGLRATGLRGTGLGETGLGETGLGGGGLHRARLGQGRVWGRRDRRSLQVRAALRTQQGRKRQLASGRRHRSWRNRRGRRRPRRGGLLAPRGGRGRAHRLGLERQRRLGRGRRQADLASAGRQTGTALGVAVSGVVVGPSLGILSTGIRHTEAAAFTDAARSVWWMLAALGIMLAVLAVLSTGRWAQATARLAAAEFEKTSARISIIPHR